VARLRAGVATVWCAVLLGACAWLPVSPASAPVVRDVTVVERPALEVNDGGGRGPRPTPTAVWDTEQGGWSYDERILVVEVEPDEDVVGYLFDRDGDLHTLTGDLRGELELDLGPEASAGDEVVLYAFRREVPMFPHEPSAQREAGLSSPVVIRVPTY
jgi:hypothetical protein